jgi:hypothetical protein
MDSTSWLSGPALGAQKWPFTGALILQGYTMPDGNYDHVKCPVCSMPWTEHTGCSWTESQTVVTEELIQDWLRPDPGAVPHPVVAEACTDVSTSDLSCLVLSEERA